MVTQPSQSDHNQLQIAIDGPVAAGKSTVARQLAKRLGITYIDTGAMYRSVAWAAQQRGVSVDDASVVAALAEDLDIRLSHNGTEHVYVDDEDISGEIRSDKIAQLASKIAVYKPLRAVLVAKQQQLAASESVVMEGRDICSVVLPQADLKIYLDAAVDERVDRYLQKILERGDDMSRENAKASIKERDEREMNRKVDPLQPTDDAWKLDTTGLSLEEVVSTIERKVKTI